MAVLRGRKLRAPKAKEMGTVDVVFPSAPETAAEALRLAARKWDGAVYSSIRISSGRVQDKLLLGVYLYLHLDHCPHCLLPEVHYLLLEDYNSGQGAPYLLLLSVLLLADKAGEAGLGLELLSLAFYPGCWRRGQAGEAPCVLLRMAAPRATGDLLLGSSWDIGGGGARRISWDEGASSWVIDRRGTDVGRCGDRSARKDARGGSMGDEPTKNRSDAF